ncbi:RING finger protein 10 isoform X2 [Aricia agestis]|uniref:RING finger protein 10 isoform X2 n=1 Tax=Aricia agestis TaxID=91739 RepID=UPI001C204E29|nr:RING finger protein 10 isoform X2 [Aricia agestis]
MAEEFRMDKKSINRSSLQQSRPHAVDCKKGAVVNKPWPRSKKREGSSNQPKNEPYRKNVLSSRGRGSMDKRPRPRDGPNLFMGGAQNTRVEDDDEPEIGSVFVPGSKKQNLSHLLNFSYPARCGGTDRGPAPRRQTQPRVSFRPKNDNYLRSHSQFVVREIGDYKLNLLDPDLPVKWDEIEEIVVRGTGKSECPICLGTPVAGRVSLCGHVYCWACVLHYAATHEKQPPPCPVCSMPLQVPDMKPARIYQWESPADEVTMRLVRRLRGSTFVELAPPRGSVAEGTDPGVLPLESLNGSPFNKFFSATKEQVMDILERDRKEIKDQIMAEIDTTEIVYLEQALQMLDLKQEKIKNQYSKSAIENETKDIPEVVYEKHEVSDRKIDWFDEQEAAASVVNVTEDMAKVNIEDKEHSDAPSEAFEEIQSSLNPAAAEFNFDGAAEEFPLIECHEPVDQEFTDIDKQNQAKYFYFYQAADGQQVFLNSINVRMLNASWGMLAAAPPVITARVLHREMLPVWEQTRKHMPCTAHLPLQCTYEVVELDLKPPYVTPEALDNFSAELDRRARTRAKQEREERRRERAYRRAMEGPPKPDISSSVLFPPAPYGSPPYVEVELPSTSVAESPSNVSSPSGLSFAKMAGASGTWSVRKAQAPLKPPTEDDEESTGPRNLVLSDAIEAALQASSTKPAGKKNKKNKQKVLFATGMQRSS